MEALQCCGMTLLIFVLLATLEILLILRLTITDVVLGDSLASTVFRKQQEGVPLGILLETWQGCQTCRGVFW